MTTQWLAHCLSPARAAVDLAALSHTGSAAHTIMLQAMMVLQPLLYLLQPCQPGALLTHMMTDSPGIMQL